MKKNACTLLLTFIRCNVIISTYPLAAISLLIHYCNLFWWLFFTKILLQPPPVAILLVNNASFHPTPPPAAILLLLLILQHILAAIVLLHHHCNLLWRFFYCYITFATYSVGSTTYNASFQPMPTLTIPATYVSLLQPLLANIMLPYHHCNLL